MFPIRASAKAVGLSHCTKLAAALLADPLSSLQAIELLNLDRSMPKWRASNRLTSLIVLRDFCSPPKHTRPSPRNHWQFKQQPALSKGRNAGEARLVAGLAVQSTLLPRPGHLQYLAPALLLCTSWMSTGGISRKDYQLGICGRQHMQPAKQSQQEQEEADTRPTEDAEALQSLSKEGYASIQDALERVILEAYKLLQEGKVDQAEYLVTEGERYSHYLNYATLLGTFRLAKRGLPAPKAADPPHNAPVNS